MHVVGSTLHLNHHLYMDIHSRHLYEMIIYIRNLPSDMDTIKETALEVIKGNYYIAHVHSENLLIYMLTDNDIIVRLLAIRRILAAREKHNMCQSPEVIIHFRMPIIDVTATHY